MEKSTIFFLKKQTQSPNKYFGFSNKFMLQSKKCISSNECFGPLVFLSSKVIRSNFNKLCQIWLFYSFFFFTFFQLFIKGLGSISPKRKYRVIWKLLSSKQVKLWLAFWIFSLKRLKLQLSRWFVLIRLFAKQIGATLL